MEERTWAKWNKSKDKNWLVLVISHVISLPRLRPNGILSSAWNSWSLLICPNLKQYCDTASKWYGFSAFRRLEVYRSKLGESYCADENDIPERVMCFSWIFGFLWWGIETTYDSIFTIKCHPEVDTTMNCCDWKFNAVKGSFGGMWRLPVVRAHMSKSTRWCCGNKRK